MRIPDLTPLLRRHFLSRAKRTAGWGREGRDIQLRQLRELLRMASGTEVGRRYDFRGLSSSGNLYREFSESVPTREYEDIREDVMRMIAGERDVLWRGRCRNFAQSSGTSGGKSKYIPITDDSLRLNHYRGAEDSLAHYLQCNPESRVFSGKSMILGGSFSNELNSLPRGVKVGDLSATLIDKVPWGVELIRIPEKRIALMSDWNEKLPQMVESAIRADVTNISGVPSWFLTVLKHVLEQTGKDTIADVWPNLEVFFHGGISFHPYREEYERITRGLRMHYMENYNASEGFFATQSELDDKSMLLLLDCGIFFEFISLENGEIVPQWEVEKGKVYELMITASNGLWRYRLGDTVLIESVDPVKISIAGRTKCFINAFGEELMEYNAERAIERVCHLTDSSIVNYTVAPVYADRGRKGRHQWLIEWEKRPDDVEMFRKELDSELQRQNSDYQAKRSGSIFLDLPEIVSVGADTFNEWLRRSGTHKMGGQRKVPRLSNDRTIADEILRIERER